jgi:acyl-coenzyme A synthetase/AMP-(fatty) acid ligase
MSAPSQCANLAELLSQWTRAFGWRERPAFLCGDDVYAHGEVHRGASRVAALLAARGAAPGDLVAIALPGSIEFVWALLGAIRLGAVALIADPEADALPDGKLAVCAADRHPRAITAHELTAGMPYAGHAPAHPVRPDTPAFVRAGVAYTHGDPEAFYLEMQSRWFLRLRQDDVLLSAPRPTDPVGRCDSVFLPMFCGASSVLEPGLTSVSNTADRLRKHRASVLLSTPSFLTRLVSGDTAGEFGSLRMAVSYGAAPPPKLVAERLGCPVVTPAAGQPLAPA